MGRALRKFFGPLAKYSWLYVVVPVSAGLFPYLVDQKDVLEDLQRFAITFVSLLCIGLPMHAAYAHLGDRLLPDQFEWRELGVHAIFVFTLPESSPQLN